MTLLVVPEVMRATVSTTGSKAGMRRVTMACSAITISQATGIGSTAFCGWEAWPPCPLTVTLILSAAASSGPARPGEDAGRNVGRDMQREGRIGQRIEMPVLQHLAGAVMALLARLEHEHHRAGQPVAMGAQRPRRPRQHGAWVSWPQACMAPSLREA